MPLLTNAQVYIFRQSPHPVILDVIRVPHRPIIDRDVRHGIVLSSP